MSREDDIQALINGVLELGETADYYESDYRWEYTCPLCYANIDAYSISNAKEAMKEIPHEHDCIYLIAKDLNTP